MDIPVDILDHIFSFVPHGETLIACSNDPVLYPIVERHLYSHITVQFGSERIADSKYTMKPCQISKLVSEHPRFIYYVRSLEIEARFGLGAQSQTVMEALDEFATTLIMLPSLQRIVLTTSGPPVWHWSAIFGAALEDRVKLLTVKDVHLVGGKDFPFSVLDNCKNVKHLSLSGSFYGAEGRFCDLAGPQLESLTLCTKSDSSSLISWIKQHVSGLQSLTCKGYSAIMLPELLGVCSGTLNKLELELELSDSLSPYFLRWDEPTKCSFQSYPNLQQLTIRTGIWVGDIGYVSDFLSFLPLAIRAVRFFNLSPRHLILDVSIALKNYTLPYLSRVDFSPLGGASLSIPQVDLYVHTGDFSPDITRTQIMSSLGKYGDIVRSIEDGAFVIHPEELAPRCV